MFYLVDEVVGWWCRGGRVLRAGTAADRCALLVPDVECDGGEEHEALDGLLPVDRDAHQRHAVVEDAHDEATDDGADNRADTAGDGSATDEGRGDRVELEVGAGLGVGGGETCCGHHAGQ